MHPMAGWSHETILEAEPLSASKARDFVSAHLAQHGLWYLVEEVRLVASELATNALSHARTPFVVTLSQTDALVILAIRDGSASVPFRAMPEPMDPGGRGVTLVESLSQDWGVSSVRRGEKSVWASFATQTRPGSSTVLARDRLGGEPFA
jgi:anti-sigma regulatory factor (Ser/Thr protein kinase)